jgi:predicted SAM-dependent methyltransferase
MMPLLSPQQDARGGRDIRQVAVLAGRRLRREGRRMAASVRSPAGVRRYLEEHPVRKLHVGAGQTSLPGWLNTDRDPDTADAAYLDATHRFPLPDAAVDYVYSEHTIEHLSYDQGVAMLRECHRVLRPGGRIRLATPDLEVMVSLVTRSDDESRQRYIRWATDEFLGAHTGYRAAHVINNAFRGWGHKFIYDEETLVAALAEAGFTDGRRQPYGRSEDPELDGLESHGEGAGNREMTQFETLVVEARKR